MNRNRNITAKAVETAVKNAAKMFEQGYTVEQDKAVPSFCIVTKPNGAFYIVDTFAGFEVCDCPQCVREGHCKHIEYAKEQLAIAARADENSENEAYGKYELMAGEF